LWGKLKESFSLAKKIRISLKIVIKNEKNVFAVRIDSGVAFGESGHRAGSKQKSTLHLRFVLLHQR
jgi:hypothetical protein